MRISAKAYGKLLIFGAYSILEPGKVGFVVNVDKGTTTSAEETSYARIVIDISNFQINVYGKDEGGRLKLTKDPEALKYFKNAVECAFKYLNKKGVMIKDLRLISENDPEMWLDNKHKTGFGSSATSTVSTVAAILALHDIKDRDTVFRVSRYSHYVSQGGLGSGVDIAAACYGSHFFLSGNDMVDESLVYSEQGSEVNIQTAYLPEQMRPVIIYTGKPASTTELIKKVMQFKEKNNQEYNDFISAYNDINIELKGAFIKGSLEEIKFLLEKSWKMRKILGERANAPIEPENLTQLIEGIKKSGAFTAGLAGAGGGDSIIAFCLDKDSEQEVIEFSRKKKLQVLDNVKIVNKGYEVNEAI